MVTFTMTATSIASLVKIQLITGQEGVCVGGGGEGGSTPIRSHLISIHTRIDLA